MHWLHVLELVKIMFIVSSLDFQHDKNTWQSNKGKSILLDCWFLNIFMLNLLVSFMLEINRDVLIVSLKLNLSKSNKFAALII